MFQTASEIDPEFPNAGGCSQDFPTFPAHVNIIMCQDLHNQHLSQHLSPMHLDDVPNTFTEHEHTHLSLMLNESQQFPYPEMWLVIFPRPEMTSPSRVPRSARGRGYFGRCRHTWDARQRTAS